MRSHIAARSRYAQIALTYTKPLPIRIWAAIMLAFLAWATVMARHEVVPGLVVLLMGGTTAAWLGAMITAHAKEQLADARAAVTPHFRAPHLIVAAVLFVIGVGGTAALMAWLHPANDALSVTGYLALIL